MRDSYKHKGLRKRLVQELVSKGISDPKVLSAIGRIPRHFFLEKAFEEIAYRDIPFQIGHDQTISQPYIVAFQTENLNINKGDKVLEIGTGSGFQAAVLAELQADVYSIERHEPLLIKAEKLLHFLGYSLHLKCGDGYQGWGEYAPFDKIIITAAPPEVPKALLYQLKIGGEMIVPVGEQESTQKMMKYTRLENQKFSIKEMIDCKFVPMLNGVKKYSNETNPK